ncbi:MAG: VOC family protein [Gemmatimonadales bacterium]|jgi:hypothetical protein
MMAVTRHAPLLMILAPLGASVQAQSPLVELDHVYLAVSDHQMAIERLREIGLNLDETMFAQHEGRGASSAFATFENAYFELVWPDSAVSLTNDNRSDFDHLSSQATWDSLSPFGVGLRRTPEAPDSLPFAGTREYDAHLEPGSFYFSFETLDEAEPEVFVVPEYMAWSALVGRLRERNPTVLEHSLGVTRLTNVTISTRVQPSAVDDASLSDVHFLRSATPLLELTFDDGRQGQTLDLRPGLPLILRY